VRRVQIVAVDPADDIAARLTQTPVDGVGLSGVGLAAPFQPRVVRGLQKVDRSVSTLAVHDQLLKFKVAPLAQHALQGLSEIIALIEGWCDDRNPHAPAVLQPLGEDAKRPFAPYIQLCECDEKCDEVSSLQADPQGNQLWSPQAQGLIHLQETVMPATANPEHREGVVAKAIEQQTAKLPSDIFLWLAGGAIIGSLILKLSGKERDALFVGHWPAPLLLLGVYNKLVKLHGSD
jgi:hypothetical protein